MNAANYEVLADAIGRAWALEYAATAVAYAPGDTANLALKQVDDTIAQVVRETGDALATDNDRYDHDRFVVAVVTAYARHYGPLPVGRARLGVQ